jgi:hypothetical protein
MGILEVSMETLAIPMETPAVAMGSWPSLWEPYHYKNLTVPTETLTIARRSGRPYGNPHDCHETLPIAMGAQKWLWEPNSPYGTMKNAKGTLKIDMGTLQSIENLAVPM